MKQVYKILGQNVPSSKNSKRIARFGKFTKVINSKLAMDYYEFIIPKLEAIRNEIKADMGDFPIRLHLYFHRKDKRKFDYINIAQIIFDAFVKCDILPDDNAYVVTPIFDGFDVCSKEKKEIECGFEFWIEK